MITLLNVLGILQLKFVQILHSFLRKDMLNITWNSRYTAERAFTPSVKYVDLGGYSFSGGRYGINVFKAALR